VILIGANNLYLSHFYPICCPFYVVLFIVDFWLLDFNLSTIFIMNLSFGAFLFFRFEFILVVSLTSSFST